MSSAIDEILYQRYLTALLAGDRAECAAIVQDVVAAGVGLKDLYVDLFQRALYEVGELWERQRISVAVEHLATAITERMLTLVQSRVLSGGPVRDHRIIIACVADEFHQLGGRMIADFCELHGWRGYFLGANVSLPALLHLIDERRPTLLGLSLTLSFNLPALLATLDAVTVRNPDLPIVVGGQAFRWGGLATLERYPMVSYIGSLDELERRMLTYEQ